MHQISAALRTPSRLAWPGTLALGLLMAVSAAPASPAQNAPSPARLTYTRTLPGSAPEYLAVRVNSDGLGTYEGRRLNEPSRPRPFRLSEATTHQLFTLAAELDHFRSLDLESHKKVANLGRKTFTYESGGERNQVQFNYTVHRPAQVLTDLFERIASVEQHIEALQYGIKYDPLGLPEELARIQVDLENRSLLEPELMVPSLEEIASNPRFLHLAQVRAQDILKTVTRDR